MPKPGEELLCLSVKSRPLFPGFYKTLTIKDPSLINAARELLQKSSLASNPYITVFLNRDRQSAVESSENGGGSGVGAVRNMDDIYPVGVLAQVSNVMPAPDDSLTLLLYPSKRVVIKKFLPPQASDDSTAETAREEEQEDEIQTAAQSFEPKPLKRPFAPSSEERQASDSGPDASSSAAAANRGVAKVLVEELQDEQDRAVGNDTTDSAQSSSQRRPSRALVKQIMETFNEIVKLNPLVREQVNDFMRAFGAQNGLYEHSSKLADFSAAMSDAEPHELQQVLQSTRADDKLKRSLLLLKKELANARLQNEISKDVERLISERDREYFLQERLKNIQKELGMETVQREKLAEKFRGRLAKLVMPDAVQKVFDEVGSN
jgi:Lon-like ATP-dependent protease